jgi:predicted GNAT family acetyltransferase
VANLANLALERLPDVHRFETRAAAFLLRREAENNLALGLITGLKGGRSFGPESPHFAIVRRGETVVAAAIRTPPHNLILTAGSDRDALPLIIEDALRAMPDTPGLSGPKDLAAAAVQLWSARTGASARVVMAQRIYQLTHVQPPRSAPGRARIARDEDRATITDWFAAFAAEALPAAGHLSSRQSAEANAAANAAGWIAGGALWVWVDDGLVAMAGAGGRTANGIRISAVYTAPDKRRRGYASSLVAALSQAQLDAGRRFCFLYTDLANATSNKIYQAIGYAPVDDVDEYRFAPGEQSGTADT